MSEMFDLNLIGGVYNKFGNEIERIYNNRNEIIWDLNDGSNDYLWVEPDESMIGTGSNYIQFLKVISPNSETYMTQNSIQYSFDGKNWEFMPYGVNVEDNRLLIDKKTYFRYVHDGYIRHRISSIHVNSSSTTEILKCNVGGSLHKYMNNVYYNDNLFESYGVVKSFFQDLAIIDASKLNVDYFKDNNARYKGYSDMFKNQSFMKYPPALKFNKLEESACSGMFYGCSSLLSAPELPATTLAERCYSDMFYGCTSLVNAPELPATTLANDCYYYMFKGCTSLVNAPELPATTLTSGCYYFMFDGCSSLSNITCYAENITTDGITDYWVRGVSATGVFNKRKGVEWPKGISGIPENWTVNEI